MKQTFQNELEQEVSLDRSVGNLFTEFLESKNKLVDFDKYAQITSVSIDGSIVRGSGGFPAKIKEILKMVVKPSQEVRFLPAVAGG